MKTYCENCGSAVYDGACTNCHEEIYIEEQYLELDMDLPDEDSVFIKRLRKCHKDINVKIRIT